MSQLNCFCAEGAHIARRGFLSGLGALGAAALLPGCQGTATAAAKPHRIDIHHHIMPPAYVAELARLGGGNPQKWSPQMSLAEMDANGIATSVLALMNPATAFNIPETDRRLARLSNDYAAQMARDFPGRFGSCLLYTSPSPRDS